MAVEGGVLLMLPREGSWKVDPVGDMISGGLLGGCQILGKGLVSGELLTDSFG